MKLLKFLLPLALLIGIWSACKDVDGEFEKTAEVTFVGQIIDEDNAPVSGAIVQAGDKSAITDPNGVFRLPATRLPANNARLSVSKSGYFEFSRAYVVENRAMQTVTIQLLEKTQVGTVSATQGGVVQVPGGPALNFPANGVMTASGGAYSGMVLVHAKFLDPAAPDLALRMPGDLRGISAGGEDQSLATFGMIAVEITGTNGEALQVATGSEVEITMPIAAAQSSAAPNSIPLWYFDLEKSRWIEEGTAQKVGNQYIGKVKHFSYWNCDDPYNLIFLSGSVFLGDEQHPLGNATVGIETNGAGSGYGYTDSEGHFGGSVPKNMPLTLKIYNYNAGTTCNYEIYSQAIGPFSDNMNLPPIIVANPQLEFTTLSGRVLDCNQQPLVNGYVKIQLSNNQTFIAFTTANGSFQTTINYCNTMNITANIVAYDLTNLLQSTAQSINLLPGAIQVNDLTVCTGSTKFVQFTLDGQLFTFIAPYSYTYPYPGQGYKTELYTLDTLPNNEHFRMAFYNNQQPGTFALTSLFVNQLDIDSITLQVNTNVSVFENLDPTYNIIGTFGGSFKTLDGGTHNINGSYRVNGE